MCQKKAIIQPMALWPAQLGYLQPNEGQMARFSPLVLQEINILMNSEGPYFLPSLTEGPEGHRPNIAL